MGTGAEEPVGRRARNPRGQGERLRADTVAALARLVSDDERMRPVSVSLRELAREAGVTAPAIYRHFSSVNEVAWAVALDGFARLLAAMDEAAGQGGSGAERLIAQAQAYAAFAAEHRGHFRLMFLVEPAVFEVSAEAAPPARELVERWRRAASGLREDGIEVGDVDAAAMYLWTAVHGRIALSPLINSVWERGDIRRFVELMVHEIVLVGGRS
ncbi:TetR/AcrR family transcriptional regulator [Amycolatopsis ultiminotia]|uniref:TetR/AcrR family transcriptional regulator n=1 Tax=Amycolatopsis ultiminotia TaxID=543629 RepID=A0ABP6W530_9PSEU